jgi:hypothetical protein
VLPLPQCEFFEHRHCPETQVPRGQSPLVTHAAGWQLPMMAPLQEAEASEQSELVAQLSVVQVPATGGVHVDVTPQSVSPLHAPPLPTSALADT